MDLTYFLQDDLFRVPEEFYFHIAILERISIMLWQFQTLAVIPFLFNFTSDTQIVHLSQTLEFFILHSLSLFWSLKCLCGNFYSYTDMIFRNHILSIALISTKPNWLGKWQWKDGLVPAIWMARVSQFNISILDTITDH